MIATTERVITWLIKHPQERAKIEAKIDEDKEDTSWERYRFFLSDIIRDRMYNSLINYLPDDAKFNALDELLCIALYSWRERVHWGEVAEFFRGYFEGETKEE